MHIKYILYMDMKFSIESFSYKILNAYEKIHLQLKNIISLLFILCIFLFSFNIFVHDSLNMK